LICCDPHLKGFHAAAQISKVKLSWLFGHVNVIVLQDAILLIGQIRKQALTAAAANDDANEVFTAFMTINVDALRAIKDRRNGIENGLRDIIRCS
jgi:hypothetical protein